MSKTGNFVKFLSLLSALILIIMTFASCGAKDMVKGEALNDSYDAPSEFDKELSYGNGKGSYDYVADSYYSKVEAEAGDITTSGSTEIQNPLEGRKVIKTVNIVSETKSFEETLSAIEREIAALGGYVQSSNIYGKTYDHYSDRRASYTLRIPAESLDSFIFKVGGFVNVTNKTEKVDDITNTYTDIESRLNALKVEEARLLELLSKGNSLSDLLTIEQRLSEVRYEIESYTARIRNYDTLIAFSTVNLEIHEVVDYTPEPIKNPTFGERIGKAFSESWKEFADGCKNFAVWFVYSLPSMITFVVIVAISILVISISVKRRKKKRSSRSVSDEENK